MGLLSSRRSHGETQGWYIWWSSNKRTHERPNVWWTTEQWWTVCLAVIEVSSYKLSLENEKATEELPPTQDIGHTWTIFQRTVEIWVKSRVSTFIMEEGYQGCLDINFLIDNCWCSKQDVVAAEHRRKSLKKTFLHVHFSVYYTTIWAFYKYISPEFSIICLIQ